MVSLFAFAVDGDPFFIFGERPEDYDVILLRSKTHFRDFTAAGRPILVVDTPDLGPADVRLIPYRSSIRHAPIRGGTRPSSVAARADLAMFEELYCQGAARMAGRASAADP